MPADKYDLFRNSWCSSCKLERRENENLLLPPGNQEGPPNNVGPIVVDWPGWTPGPGDDGIINLAQVMDLPEHDPEDETQPIEGSPISLKIACDRKPTLAKARLSFQGSPSKSGPQPGQGWHSPRRPGS